MSQTVKNAIQLRKHPFPYKCALSICSDIDECTAKDFLEIHRFLNTKTMTSMGRGIGLEIGDSFWLYSDKPGDLSYFEGRSNKPSLYAEMIRDFIRSGFIDCLHTYGNFVCDDQSMDLPERSLFKQGLEELRRRNLGVSVWINHGGNENLMNLKARNHPSFAGDIKDAPYYHADILRAYGIKFAWLNELTDKVVHDVRFWKDPFAQLNMSGINVVRNVVKRAIGLGRKTKSTYYLNKLIEPILLRDGQFILSFKRFHRGIGTMWEGADREGLTRQLSQEVLSELILKQGTLIIYTHLGKTMHGKKDSIFNNETLRGLRRLEEECRNGNIFVTTTSRLLNYCSIRDGLVWDSRFLKNGGINIYIDSVEDPVSGSYQPKASDLQGITFFAPRIGKMQIVLGKKVVSTTSVRDNTTGELFVQIPFIPLRYPERYLRGTFGQLVV